MWSLFSRDPLKDFSYEVGEKVSGLEDKSIWSLHEGKHKTSGETVSIFAFDVKGSSETQVQVAKAAFKRMKTLRHPNILTYVDGFENDKVLYIVTEFVMPLETYLKDNEAYGGQNELAISWGLHQITKGLSFLINDCQLIHNNVCMCSVFADKAGEWKIAGVDYMYPASGPDSIPPVKILPALERYDPPEKSDQRGRKMAEKWSSDMWGLGILIWEVFNGHLPRNSSLKALGKIPKNLVVHFCELIGANPRSRPNPAKFIENCRGRNGFMNNKFVDTMLFMEEIQIKDQQEKIAFFNSLPAVLDTFPKPFCKYKILPQLLNAFEYGNAGPSVLQPLFKLGKLLNEAEYQTKIVPCVVKLFSSTDRATRVKLLQQLEIFVDYLQPEIVNDKIFPNVVQGFMDTNPVVREHTIKAMLHLAPKLNYKNLNEELLKHFARLQTKDDQGGIRTNTTVCLGKIACHLNPAMRQKVLTSAYLRSIRDPFPPARQAGVLAMGATHHFFTLAESSNQLLPALCRMTLDPDKGVRDQTFKAIKCFLGKLEKVSENPELQADMEKDVTTGGSAATNAAGWAGWAMGGMSSLTSKLIKGKGQGQPKPATPASSPAVVLGKKEPSNLPESTHDKSEPQTVPQPIEEPTVEEEDFDDKDNKWGDTDGWDNDEWGDMEDTTKTSTVDDSNDKNEGDGWDNDDWGSLEETSSKPKNLTQSTAAMSLNPKQDPSPWGSADFVSIEDNTTKSAASYDWGGTDNLEGTGEDFFSTVLGETNKKASTRISSKPTSKRNTPSRSSSSKESSPAPVTQKTKDQGRGEGSGWGEESGWGDDNWGEIDSGPSKADIAKKQREEKRLQRQKELEEKRAARAGGGGAMKLGAKKVAKD